MTTTTQILTVSDFQLQLPASATCFVEQISIRDVLKSDQCVPRSNMFKVSILMHILKVYLQFLDLNKQFQLVTQRGREAVNDQRETARSALLHQQRKFCCHLSVDFTCLNCFSQTHFASAFEIELVNPDVECVLSWRRVSCEQQLDTFHFWCQFCGNQSVSGVHLWSAF